jgi:hypothetical protein
MSHAFVKGIQLQIATLSMQIWTWEEISSRNPKVEASKNVQSGTQFLICLQEILAL